MPCVSFATARCLLACAASLVAHPVLAQRTQENVITQSSDAFGRSVGNERSGLYSQEDVRGFNPVDAGNARIEGLYFDQVERVPQRLIDGNSIRVGISALGYPFPAPTGLVDYSLTKPGSRFVGNFDVDRGNYGGPGGSVEIKLPLLGDVLGLSAGVGGREAARPEGGRHSNRNFGATLVARPYGSAELAAFVGGISSRSEEARPTLFPASDILPPRVPRRVFLGQRWTPRDGDGLTGGLAAFLPIGGTRLEAGLFYSRRDSKSGFADLLTGVSPDGSALNRTIIASGRTLEDSISGELRVVKRWTAGSLEHQIVLGVRGRSKFRTFGGTQRIALGPSSAIVADFRPAPVIVAGIKDEDRVRQLTVGASYSLRWKGLLGLDAGMAQSRYTKRLSFADPTRADTTTLDRPLLWNAALSVTPSASVTFYASMARGQEEALIAPDVAVNRSEAPPALRTQQIEAGFRWSGIKGISLLGSVFEITKPYYNLDSALRYRELGSIRNRGLELSLTARLDQGLTIVAGTLLLDPVISGEAVASGQIGQRPVGQVRRRTVINADYRMSGGKGAWSFDLAIESLSSRFANSSNTLVAPPRTNVNLGARYRFAAVGTTFVLRPQIQNLFDDYGWQVSSSGGFTYTNGRTWNVQLIGDF